MWPAQRVGMEVRVTNISWIILSIDTTRPQGAGTAVAAIGAGKTRA